MTSQKKGTGRYAGEGIGLKGTPSPLSFDRENQEFQTIPKMASQKGKQVNP